VGGVLSVWANQVSGRSAYVVVVGNEKGGSGKSTLAVHIAVALMKAGQRVATIDLDSRQKSFTRYIRNRVAWRSRNRIELEVPTHFYVERSEGIRTDENEAAEFNGFADKIAALDKKHDFVVIDTPGNDTYLMRLAHSMADTLITPLNDSYLDFDLLGAVDAVDYELTKPGPYSEMVREARRARHEVDKSDIDWIVVRNRLSNLDSRNKRRLTKGLKELGLQLGFRCVDGFSERTVYREFFPRGLTALDINKSTLEKRPNRSHIAARQEVETLLAALKLPINEQGRRRFAARMEWFASNDSQLEVHNLFG
jgi:chromosome partitioning protein